MLLERLQRLLGPSDHPAPLDAGVAALGEPGAPPPRRAEGRAAAGRLGPSEIRRYLAPELERLVRKGQLGGVGGTPLGGRRRDG